MSFFLDALTGDKDDFVSLQVKDEQMAVARDAFIGAPVEDLHVAETYTCAVLEAARGRDHVSTCDNAGWLLHFRVGARRFWLRCGSSHIDLSDGESILDHYANWTGVGIDDIGYLSDNEITACCKRK